MDQYVYHTYHVYRSAFERLTGTIINALHSRSIHCLLSLYGDDCLYRSHGAVS